MVIVVHGGAGEAPQAGKEETTRGLRIALEGGWECLRAGQPALEAVAQAVAAMEDFPAFNAAVGACLDARGKVGLDASIMAGTGQRAGAVADLRRIRNPILLARFLLERGPHLFMVGRGAERFAKRAGFSLIDPAELVTEEQRARWRARRRRKPEHGSGTVGAVALDRAGAVAAATSTGGISGKLPGRVGDSAVIGAGTWADDEAGAVSATGQGEAIIRIGLARAVIERLKTGRPAAEAALEAIEELSKKTGGRAGVIVVDRLGRFAARWNTASMSWGWRTEQGGREEVA